MKVFAVSALPLLLANAAAAQGHQPHASTPAAAAAGHSTHVMPAEPGADQGPGSEPPVPADYAADRVFDPKIMAAARAAAHQAHGGERFSMLRVNLAEYQAVKGRDGYRWEGEAWYGGDINRLVLKSEGEGVFNGATQSAEAQALYSRAIGPYFDLQAGVRYDIEPDPTRAYATIGAEGLAPYFVDTQAAVFLSSKGDVLARIEGAYDQLITQHLILQPRIEMNLAAQDVPENDIGAGLADIELGLRLRYEIKREFAPYIGVSYTRKTGNTADFARGAGEPAGTTSFVAGIRAWF